MTIIIDDTALCGRFLRSSTNQLIMMALIVVNKCVLRGRPQGGRAVFIPLIDRAIELETRIPMVVLLLLLSLFLEIWIRIWNVDC